MNWHTCTDCATVSLSYMCLLTTNAMLCQEQPLWAHVLTMLVKVSLMLMPKTSEIPAVPGDFKYWFLYCTKQAMVHAHAIGCCRATGLG